MRLFYWIGLIALLLSGCDSEGSAKSDFKAGSDLELYETLVDSSEDE